jgi:hypothetical protein
VDSAKCRRGVVTEPNSAVGAGVAGRMGTGRDGDVRVLGMVMFLVVGDTGKIYVCAGVRR